MARAFQKHIFGFGCNIFTLTVDAPPQFKTFLIPHMPFIVHSASQPDIFKHDAIVAQHVSPFESLLVIVNLPV